MRLSPHFTLAEMTRTGTGLPNDPPPDVIEALCYLCVHVLEPLRAIAGGPLRVTSGYRSPAVNAAVGGAAGSQHARGEAADVVPTTCSRDELLVRAVVAVREGRLPADQIITYDGKPHLHISGTSRRAPRGEVLAHRGGRYRVWDAS